MKILSNITKLLCSVLTSVLCFGFLQAREPLADASTQVGKSKGFQGLWQQRKGHGLYFDYGYQTGALAYNRYYRGYMIYKPLRFDLSYQYDIPWHPRRINFYAHAGLGYRQLKTDYKDLYSLYQGPLVILPEFEKGVTAYAGIGMKIHCTDWLHLAFSEALNVMHETGHGDFIGEGEHSPLPPGWKHTLVGLQSSFRLVGQVKGFSLYVGYRLDHWLKTFPDYLKWPYSLTTTDKNGKYEGYLTVGVGYAF